MQLWFCRHKHSLFHHLDFFYLLCHSYVRYNPAIWQKTKSNQSRMSFLVFMHLKVKLCVSKYVSDTCGKYGTKNLPLPSYVCYNIALLYWYICYSRLITRLPGFKTINHQNRWTAALFSTFSNQLLFQVSIRKHDSLGSSSAASSFPITSLCIHTCLYWAYEISRIKQVQIGTWWKTSSFCWDKYTCHVFTPSTALDNLMADVILVVTAILQAKMMCLQLWENPESFKFCLTQHMTRCPQLSGKTIVVSVHSADIHSLTHSLTGVHHL